MTAMKVMRVPWFSLFKVQEDTKYWTLLSVTGRTDTVAAEKSSEDVGNPLRAPLLSNKDVCAMCDCGLSLVCCVTIVITFTISSQTPLSCLGTADVQT